MWYYGLVYALSFYSDLTSSMKAVGLQSNIVIAFRLVVVEVKTSLPMR